MTIRQISISLLFTASLVAQDSEQAPIRAWPAPLYWQQSLDQSDSQATAAKTNQRSATVLASTLVFVGIAPCRLVETRDGSLPAPFGPPTMGASQIRTITVPTSTRCNIPSSAQAYSLNFTVVPSGFLGYLSAWPTGNRPSPDVSILNSLTGQVIANAAVIPAGTSGSFDVFVTNVTEVVIDINGYYVFPSATPLNGTASAPAVTFGNTSTGLFSTAANTVSIGTCGQSRLIVRSDGDLDLTGNIRQNGQLLINTPSLYSTSLGLGAMASVNGGADTAVGYFALNANTTGDSNTAVGSSALSKNVTSCCNTAVGLTALSHATGARNTAL